MNFLDHFDRVQIVNVATRLDRRQDTVKELSRHGLSIEQQHVEFFDAVTPDTPSGFPTLGARGCFLSHLEILKKAENDTVSRLLILEDDIAFSRKLKDEHQNIFASLNSRDWDIAYFGHNLTSDEKGIRWLRTRENIGLSHFYAVNRSAQKKLIDFLELLLSRPAGHPDGGPMHYDGALNTFRLSNPELNIFHLSSNLGYQRPSKTDIHENSIIDRMPILKSAVQLLRKLKWLIMRRNI